ncbi:MAG: DUF1499 domain-containing protein [Proteobacteria bacterium]|nr:DUF1499 domain-containing protein [Pseudomonadota bacterium]MDA1356147.1 DUF1499 domain-containing protein [Pseudomonadota bacterium]
MARARMRNHFIAATIGSAVEAPDIVIPAFTCDAARLYATLREYALTEPRTKLQSESPNENHMSFVQRTAYWHFPDDVVAEITALKNGGAALMLSSKARYGMEDFGVNQRRVKRWIAALEARLTKET